VCQCFDRLEKDRIFRTCSDPVRLFGVRFGLPDQWNGYRKEPKTGHRLISMNDLELGVPNGYLAVGYYFERERVLFIGTQFSILYT
jgi:hypothetical protein